MKFISPGISNLSKDEYYEHPEPTEDSIFINHYSRHYTFWDGGHKNYFHDHNPYTRWGDRRDYYRYKSMVADDPQDYDVYNNPYYKVSWFAVFAISVVLNFYVLVYVNLEECYVAHKHEDPGDGEPEFGFGRLGLRIIDSYEIAVCTVYGFMK